MIFRLSSNLGDSMFSKDGGSSAFLDGLFCCLNTFIIEKGVPCILLEFSVFRLVSTLVYSTLQQVSVPRASCCSPGTLLTHSAFPPDPFLKLSASQPAPHTCPAWPLPLNFTKVLLAPFSSPSSSVTTSSPSLTVRESLH